jgi:hypothetical protein
MSTNMPSRDIEALQWLEARISEWNLNFASIGLTSASVLDLAQDLANTRTAFTSIATAKAAAKDATADFHNQGKAMRTKASAMIATVKGFAQSSQTPQAVYDAASISPRNPPSPTPAPATPHNLRAQIGAAGSVDIEWDGTGATGTVYEVYRRLPTETNFDLLAVVDAKSKAFNDATLPVGTTFSTYQVRAVRAETQSPMSTQFNIQFGPVAPPAEGGASEAA